MQRRCRWSICGRRRKGSRRSPGRAATLRADLQVRTSLLSSPGSSPTNFELLCELLEFTFQDTTLWLITSSCQQKFSRGGDLLLTATFENSNSDRHFGVGRSIFRTRLQLSTMVAKILGWRIYYSAFAKNRTSLDQFRNSHCQESKLNIVDDWRTITKVGASRRAQLGIEARGSDLKECCKLSKSRMARACSCVCVCLSSGDVSIVGLY